MNTHYAGILNICLPGIRHPPGTARVPEEEETGLVGASESRAASCSGRTWRLVQAGLGAVQAGLGVLFRRTWQLPDLVSTPTFRDLNVGVCLS